MNSELSTRLEHFLYAQSVRLRRETAREVRSAKWNDTHAWNEMEVRMLPWQLQSDKAWMHGIKQRMAEHLIARECGIISAAMTA